VGNAQKFFNPACYDAVNDAYKAVQDLIAAKNDEELDNLFGICETKKLNYSDPYEVQTFYSGLIDFWMSATQYNAVGDNSVVSNFCKVMTTAQLGDPIKRLAALSKSVGSPCINTDYHQIINQLKEEAWDSPYVSGGSRQWIWQTCTEFAYYQSTDSNKQPFGVGTVGIKYLEELYCKQPFGITSQDIATNVALTNKRYGGRAPNATKVFFFNGSIDPWHTLSVYGGDLNTSSPSRYIEGTSHCYDMYEAKPDDPPSLTQARKDMAATLTSWLAD